MSLQVNHFHFSLNAVNLVFYMSILLSYSRFERHKSGRGGNCWMAPSGFWIGPSNLFLRVNAHIKTDPLNSLVRNTSDAKSLTWKLQLMTFLIDMTYLISLPSVLIKSSKIQKICILKDCWEVFLCYRDPRDLWECTDAGSASSCLCSDPAIGTKPAPEQLCLCICAHKCVTVCTCGEGIGSSQREFIQ